MTTNLLVEQVSEEQIMTTNLWVEQIMTTNLLVEQVSEEQIMTTNLLVEQVNEDFMKELFNRIFQIIIVLLLISWFVNLLIELFN